MRRAHIRSDTRRSAVPAAASPSAPSAAHVRSVQNIERIPVTVVIPLFNEEESVANLFMVLDSAKRCLDANYDLHFVLVDDGSTDQTWTLLKAEAAVRKDCWLTQHSRNKGITAAIMTGIQLATTEIVCSIDSDCTYDPRELGQLIGLLGNDVDMVTGSPYHPNGKVMNVPKWRLALSKSASWMYRRILNQNIYTFTSCFRAYRRSAVLQLTLEEDGFLGVAEMLGKLSLKGSRIREYPATLSVRLLGTSKMKVLRTITGHLLLMFRLSRERRRARGLSQEIDTPSTPPSAPELKL